MAYGFHGRVLAIDLTARAWRVLATDPEVQARELGGKALAGHFLEPLATLAHDDPDLPLLFMAGPLTGTAAPTSGRMSVMSVSPLTGAICDASVGGRLGWELKKAGYDGLVVTGRADGPTGLIVKDDRIRFEDARNLAGADTPAVFEALGRFGSVAAIGPAAETGCLFAAIVVDRHHAAGRGGLGLVMAQKGLKFLSVKGSGVIPVADKADLAAAREDIVRLTNASPVLMGGHGFSCFGTASLYDLMDARRMMPTRNFRQTRFEHAADLGAPRLKETYDPKKYGCRGCHILCKKIAKDGRALPEFETLSHYTALLGLRDLETVMAANAICNRLGFDTISAAGTLACHAELIGRDLAPGEVLGLLDDMGRGRGQGRELARGSRLLAASRGRPETAMAVKGLELPAYDPRGAYGMALAYAVSTRGGCHLRAYPVSHEILRKPVATDRFTFTGKARIIKIAEDANAAVDSLAACKFTFFAASIEEYAHALRAVTGQETSAHDLMRLGERTVYRERLMNARRGLAAPDDDLPPRFFDEPGTSGETFTVPPLDRQAFLDARARYYAIRGLTPDGRPTPAKAAELGLAWND